MRAWWCIFTLAITVVSLPAPAATVGLDAFRSPTIIDFDGLPYGSIDDFYSAQGVSFLYLFGGETYGTGSGNPYSATNFQLYTVPYPDAEASFSGLINRVGFYITTSASDDTTVYAYIGDALIGSETFNTGGGGLSGSFVGVDFQSGFDRIVIDTYGAFNGAFAIDDLRFESVVVSAPGSLGLLGIGLAGLALMRKPKNQ